MQGCNHPEPSWVLGLPEDTWMLTHTLSAAVRGPLSVSAPSRLTDLLFCCIGTNFAGQIGDVCLEKKKTQTFEQQQSDVHRRGSSALLRRQSAT